MQGSRIAEEIIQEQKREEAFRKKAIREQCRDKECEECKYIEICDNKKD